MAEHQVRRLPVIDAHDLVDEEDVGGLGRHLLGAVTQAG